MSNERIIRDFIEAWSRLDVDELVDYFTPDGIYHNMPTAPVQGVDNLRRLIGAVVGGWEKTDWEVVNILAAGDLVVAERVDRTVAQGKSVDLPCLGIFEMRDGKIAAWRDYFDMTTYTSGLSP